jgi:hypothetical protein
MKVRKSSIKENWKRIWDFLWNSDSIWSWIADLVLLYLIVRLVFFPLLSLIFATPLPSVIVESGSLEHKLVHPCLDYNSRGKCIELNKNVYEICGVEFTEKQEENFDLFWQACGKWYEQRNITKSDFLTWPYHNGIDKGDIIIVSGRWKKNLKVGDIIIFDAKQPLPIIHRVMSTDVLSTKGDHNKAQLNFEKNISEEQVIGKAILRIPKVGWVKLFFVKLFSEY